TLTRNIRLSYSHMQPDITNNDNTNRSMEEIILAMENRIFSVIDQKLAAIQLQRNESEQDSEDDNDQPDPRFVPAKLADTFYPSEDQKEQFPDMYPNDPQDFFDREPLEVFKDFPKNARRSYTAPPHSAAFQPSPMGKKADEALIKIQQRVAHLTRPLDYARTMAENVDPEARELINHFGTFMAQQLQDSASSISKFRIELVQKDGNFPAPSSSTRPLLDPQQEADRIKASKALSKAFGRAESSGSNRGYKRNQQQQKRSNKQQSRKQSNRSRNNNNNKEDDSDDTDNQSFFSKNNNQNTRRKRSQSRGRGQNNSK
ncbi:hypothetical protein BGZ46_001947, partial [Entomortierella lignicola]